MLKTKNSKTLIHTPKTMHDFQSHQGLTNVSDMYCLMIKTLGLRHLIIYVVLEMTIALAFQLARHLGTTKYDI